MAPSFPHFGLRTSDFGLLLSLSLACVALPFPSPSAPAWNDPPDRQSGGFWRPHWYEGGLTNGNPAYQGRFRINSPEASVTPWIAARAESRENGMMLIRAEEDLLQLTGAELYLELWGGHPGTANKRVTINGRSTYALPEVGTARKHCTYSYPAVPLKLSDLVNGYNACQFALDQGKTFWGHALVDNACLRVALTNNHPDLAANGLARFTARVASEVDEALQTVQLRLICETLDLTRIESVIYQGWYEGYDENGDGLNRDWHGFTRNRRHVAVLGASASVPFAASWDVSMIPAQKNVAIRALVFLKDHPDLIYTSPAVCGIEIPKRKDSTVRVFAATDMPAPFWSRDGQRKTCRIDLGRVAGRIERAQLHVIAWTGGPGNVKEYFKLNGRHYPVAEGSRHELVYSVFPVDPDHLAKGPNAVELLSDTEHHGIEICLPGPALVIRSTTAAVPD